MAQYLPLDNRSSPREESFNCKFCSRAHLCYSSPINTDWRRGFVAGSHHSSSRNSNFYQFHKDPKAGCEMGLCGIQLLSREEVALLKGQQQSFLFFFFCLGLSLNLEWWSTWLFHFTLQLVCCNWLYLSAYFFSYKYHERTHAARTRKPESLPCNNNSLLFSVLCSQ